MNSRRFFTRFVTRRVLLVLWLVLALVVLASCDDVRVTPSRVTATATFSGKDGLSQSVTHSFNLTHSVSDTLASRVATTVVPIYDVNDFKVTVTRTGLPIAESFVLVGISQQHFAPGSDVDVPYVVADDPTYVRTHIGQVIRLVVDTDRVDAPLETSLIDPFPKRIMSTSYAILARWEADDSCMAFEDSNAVMDVQDLASAMFTALSDAVAEADQDSLLFGLGGSNSDGDFEMFFVPYTQHSTRMSEGTPSNGFTFIFKATLSVGPTTADVYIPASFLFDRVRSSTSSDVLEASLDLIQFSDTQTEDRKRISVIAEGPFAESVARAIREGILDAVTNLPRATIDDIDLKTQLLSVAVNSLRPNGGAGRLPETVRVILLPNSGNGQQFNRIMPTAELRPRLCILD